MPRLSGSVVRFAIVGAIGFAIDGGAMELLTATTATSPLIARAFSFPLALSATRALNRAWTFPTGRERTPVAQYRRYLAVQIAGFVVNYALFAALVQSGGIWQEQPLLALVIGGLVSMITTYALSRALVFSAVPPAAPTI
jgi:putative flippase GtrA